MNISEDRVFNLLSPNYLIGHLKSKDIGRHKFSIQTFAMSPFRHLSKHLTVPFSNAGVEVVRGAQGSSDGVTSTHYSCVRAVRQHTRRGVRQTMLPRTY